MDGKDTIVLFPVAETEMVNCDFLTERRASCHSVYGPNRGEECVHEDLVEKRCISAQRCPRQALEYYGVQDEDFGSGADAGFEGARQATGGNSTYQKALCSSWAESFAYADKALEHGEEIARHHQEARRIVMNDSKLRKECRQIAMNLAECMRATKK